MTEPFAPPITSRLDAPAGRLPRIAGWAVVIGAVTGALAGAVFTTRLVDAFSLFSAEGFAASTAPRGILHGVAPNWSLFATFLAALVVGRPAGESGPRPEAAWLGGILVVAYVPTALAAFAAAVAVIGASGIPAGPSDWIEWLDWTDIVGILAGLSLRGVALVALWWSARPADRLGRLALPTQVFACYLATFVINTAATLCMDLVCA